MKRMLLFEGARLETHVICLSRYVLDLSLRCSTHALIAVAKNIYAVSNQAIMVFRLSNTYNGPHRLVWCVISTLLEPFTELSPHLASAETGENGGSPSRGWPRLGLVKWSFGVGNENAIECA